MEIYKASEHDIRVIHELAEKIWRPTYRSILSEEQISFMLEDMYSENALREQMNHDIKFILVKRDNEEVAFAGYSIDNEEILKIHKIYVLPSEQGKGTGKKLIGHLTSIAEELAIGILELNVNRANPALSFYQKLGFDIHDIVDIPYHQFVLNDYVMRKIIRPF